MMMHQKPTVYVPPWSSLFDDPSAVGPVSGVSAGGSLLAALQRYQCGGVGDGDTYEYDDSDDDLPDSAVDAYSCDEFRMYDFKVRRCARGRSHDWTECPYAHPGEKARRRDPRKYHYSGTACPDFRKGSCKRGDACDMAHGVFECWLHPARYRTQRCKDGTACRRRVCFFAHTPDQLRVLPQSPRTPLESYDGSPMRQQHQLTLGAPSSHSPPMSPTERGEADSSPMSPEAAAVLASLRKLQLGKVKSMPMPGQGFGLGFGSPRGAASGGGGGVGGGFSAGFCSLPTTPTRTVTGFDGRFPGEEDHVERVESGRALRAKMYERLSKENSGSGMEQEAAPGGAGPDVGWISDLLM